MEESSFINYAALLDFSFGQRSPIGTPRALAIALRKTLDLDRPSMTWYIATLVTPARRAISAPEISFSSILIFIRVANFIMINVYLHSFNEHVKKNSSQGEYL